MYNPALSRGGKGGIGLMHSLAMKSLEIEVEFWFQKDMKMKMEYLNDSFIKLELNDDSFDFQLFTPLQDKAGCFSKDDAIGSQRVNISTCMLFGLYFFKINNKNGLNKLFNIHIFLINEASCI